MHSKQADLGRGVNHRSLVQQQGGHLAVSFLRGQVQWTDSLLGEHVGLSTILHQGRGNGCLVLLRCNVEGRVAILAQQKDTKNGV